MHLNRITHTSHPMYQTALELYQISFPCHEQRERLSQERILSDKEYRFSLIYDADVFVGLALYWETADLIYLEHFCMLPEMRNRQYGQKTLALLMESRKTLVLEIDPPVDALSRRRAGFYQRCGLKENAFRHIHPPYHSGNEGHELIVMSYPRQLSQAAYDAFSQYLKTRVMAHAFS